MPNQTVDESLIVLKTATDVKKLSPGEIRRRMRNPELYAQMQQALATPEPADEPAAEIVVTDTEVADAAAVQAAADEEVRKAAQKLVDDAVAKAAADEAARKAAEDARPQRKVFEYQVTDDAGHPIGNKTHLEYFTNEEFVEKMQLAHVNAMRLADRLRKTKPAQPAVAPVGLLTPKEYAQAQQDILGDDKDKAEEAKKKLIQHTAAQKEQQTVNPVEVARIHEITYAFLNNHVNDFYRCAANQKVIKDFIQENDLEWSLENLEFAFVRVQDKLAPNPASVRVPVLEVVPNPQAPAPVVPVAPAPPAAVLPTPVAPSAPPAPAAVPNPPASAPRKAPNGGLEPGSMSGGRVDQPAGLTLRDIGKWTPAEMKKQMRDPQVKAAVLKLIADRNAAVAKAKQLA